MYDVEIAPDILEFEDNEKFRDASSGFDIKNMRNTIILYPTCEHIEEVYYRHFNIEKQNNKVQKKMYLIDSFRFQGIPFLKSKDTRKKVENGCINYLTTSVCSTI
jgi:hypothetical protein